MPDLPFSIEAEQGLLGALLLNNGVMDRLVGLEPEHFYDPVHGRVFGIARELIGKGRSASVGNLKPIVQQDEGLKELGGIDYIARLMGAAVSIVAAPDYARTLRDLAARRDIIRIADEMQARAAESFDASIDDQIDGAEGALTEIRVREGETKLVFSFRESLTEAADWAQEAFQREGRPHISTGLTRLDDLIGGLKRSRLYLLAGMSSMGKSGLGIEIAGALMQQGHGVLFASLEMPKAEVAQRRVSSHLARKGLILPHRDIADGIRSEETFRTYLEASHDMEREPFLMAEDGAVSIARLRASIVRARKTLERTPTPLGAVFIDYLQLIRVPGAKDRVAEVGHAVREMKQWAKEFEIPIMALAQVKDEVEKRPNKRPMKQDIQWASEAHHAADVVLMVYRHDYYLSQEIEGAEGQAKSELIAERADCAGAVEVLCRKQRGGPLGTAIVYADLATNRFADRRIEAAKASIDQTEFGI